MTLCIYILSERSIWHRKIYFYFNSFGETDVFAIYQKVEDSMLENIKLYLKLIIHLIRITF